jgi:hypothetical protein
MSGRDVDTSTCSLGAIYSLVCVIILCKESSAISRVSGPLKAGFPLLRHT